MDKVRDHEKEKTVILSCRHFFLDVKKHESLLVTKDLPEFDLYSGMKGSVERVLLYQRLEVKFFYDSSLFDPWIKKKLSKYQSLLIKEKDFF